MMGMEERIEVVGRTFATNHARRMTIFLDAELCNLKELLGPLEEVVGVYQPLKPIRGDRGRRRRCGEDGVVFARVIVRGREKWNLESTGASQQRKSDRQRQ